MYILSEVSDKVCEQIIAAEYHADVLDYLSSVVELPDDWADKVKWAVCDQLCMLFHVVSRTSADDDFSQRHAVDIAVNIARKLITLTIDEVIFPTYYSSVASPCVCLLTALSMPASYQ